MAEQRPPEVPTEKPAIESLREWIDFGIGMMILLGIACFVLAGVFQIYELIVGGTVSWVLSFWLAGLLVIPPPEVWIIERFGRYSRNLPSDIPWYRKWRIPVIETVRAKPRLWEQPVPIFTNKIDVDFRDGTAPAVSPEVYVRIDSKHPENAIYKVKDWVKWIQDTIDPLGRGYLNSLLVREAIDEGMARGNLLDRMERAEEITKDKLKEIGGRIKGLEEEIEKEPEEKKEEKRKILQPLIDELRRREEELKPYPSLYAKIQDDVKKLEEDAKERGIEEICRIVIADFNLPPSVKEAREAPLKARREAEAALWEATKEATLRSEPIAQTKAKLMEIGFEEGEALTRAFDLDVLETLAKNKIWSAGVERIIKIATTALADAIATRRAP